MKPIFIAAATAILTATGIVHAQQHQDYGRGSLYVSPGQQSQRSAPVGNGLVNHFGRDSLYVTQLPSSPSTAPAQAQSNQYFGRDSVYAKETPRLQSGAGGDTNVGAFDRKHGHGG